VLSLPTSFSRGLQDDYGKANEGPGGGRGICPVPLQRWLSFIDFEIFGNPKKITISNKKQTSI